MTSGIVLNIAILLVWANQGVPSILKRERTALIMGTKCTLPKTLLTPRNKIVNCSERVIYNVALTTYTTPQANKLQCESRCNREDIARYLPKILQKYL